MTEKYNYPLLQKFADGSTIETDAKTGNRTVIGKLAHDEYFRQLRSEQITANTSPAIMAFCTNPDGTRKAELIRVNTKPLLIDTFGRYCWQVWEASDPANVTLCQSEESAREKFGAAMLRGTNGYGTQVSRIEVQS